MTLSIVDFLLSSMDLSKIKFLHFNYGKDERRREERGAEENLKV
jgi:hypothetical protein